MTPLKDDSLPIKPAQRILMALHRRQLLVGEILDRYDEAVEVVETALEQIREEAEVTQ